MSRDPRRDPTPGDHLERGGVARRVLEVGPDYVRFDLPGMSREAPKRVERATWDRWAKRARPVDPAEQVRRLEVAVVDPPAAPARRPLSERGRKVLAAILLLPTGEDGWRRAEHRDQLHESVGLSRGGVARSFASGELAGLVVAQGVGRSARTPEGYKLTDEGERLAREAGSIQPDPAPIQPPDPVLVPDSSSSPPKTKEKQEPTNDDEGGADPAPRSSLPDPAPASGPLRLELGPETLAVLYAAVTGAPLCACVRPMVQRRQGKSQVRFWGCLRGKAGCGVTLSVDDQGPPRRQRGRPASEPTRVADDLSTMDATRWKARLAEVADAKHA